MSAWVTRIKVLLISAVFISITNMITSWKAGAIVMPWESIPGLAILFVVIVLGCLMEELFAKYLHIEAPSVIFIATLMVFVGIPGLSPIAEFTTASLAKISLLPLCTPILAYAGIAIGKDLDDFKKQGIAIVCVALCTFFGTYAGSVVIAEIALRLTGVI